MFVVWMYLFVAYWDCFGSRATIERVHKYLVPSVLRRKPVDWPPSRQPPQPAGSYG